MNSRFIYPIGLMFCLVMILGGCFYGEPLVSESLGISDQLGTKDQSLPFFYTLPQTWGPIHTGVRSNWWSNTQGNQSRVVRIGTDQWSLLTVNPAQEHQVLELSEKHPDFFHGLEPRKFQILGLPELEVPEFVLIDLERSRANSNRGAREPGLYLFDLRAQATNSPVLMVRDLGSTVHSWHGLRTDHGIILTLVKTHGLEVYVFPETQSNVTQGNSAQANLAIGLEQRAQTYQFQPWVQDNLVVEELLFPKTLLMDQGFLTLVVSRGRTQEARLHWIHWDSKGNFLNHEYHPWGFLHLSDRVGLGTGVSNHSMDIHYHGFVAHVTPEHQVLVLGREIVSQATSLSQPATRSVVFQYDPSASQSEVKVTRMFESASQPLQIHGSLEFLPTFQGISWVRYDQQQQRGYFEVASLETSEVYSPINTLRSLVSGIVTQDLGSDHQTGRSLTLIQQVPGTSLANQQRNQSLVRSHFEGSRPYVRYGLIPLEGSWPESVLTLLLALVLSIPFGILRLILVGWPALLVSWILFAGLERHYSEVYKKAQLALLGMSFALILLSLHQFPLENPLVQFTNPIQTLGSIGSALWVGLGLYTKKTRSRLLTPGALVTILMIQSIVLLVPSSMQIILTSLL